MALGATPRNIYSLAFGDAGPAVFAGLGMGMIGGILGGRLVRELLYGVQTVDPWVILRVAALFLGAALAAGFLPARRAASVDPMETLRAE
jgi:ABC-type antimicrobial peptide transport system permease subunit